MLLFNLISVEILGTIYERFLGKIVRPHGRGVMIEEKPEVRKAGGVYYTPSYIVDYIVEQTVGKLVDDKKPADTLKLTVLDPACGSGSFLIRAYERLCEHWQRHLTRNPEARKKKLCWVDAVTGDVHLTVSLKREILTNNIYGVDLDAAAVEVTQLSLYLKMLENENRNTLARERELFAEDIALLPPLQDNIKNGNSLIASDFSMMAEDLIRVRAFDWPVQFAPIMKAGGFDAVIGNPPYLSSAGQESISYFNERYRLSEYQTDFYTYFIEKALT
ncbi:MAG: Eco57I restriction-modification methylase domain-containing protein, partial [Limisphaerales bacterium]